MSTIWLLVITQLGLMNPMPVYQWKWVLYFSVDFWILITQVKFPRSRYQTRSYSGRPSVLPGSRSPIISFLHREIPTFSCRESTPSADDAASCCSASDELSSNSSITRFPKLQSCSTSSTLPFQLNDCAAVRNLCHDHVLFPFFILHRLPFPSILPKVWKFTANQVLRITWWLDLFPLWSFFQACWDERCHRYRLRPDHRHKLPGCVHCHSLHRQPPRLHRGQVCLRHRHPRRRRLLPSVRLPRVLWAWQHFHHNECSYQVRWKWSDILIGINDMSGLPVPSRKNRIFWTGICWRLN